MVRFGGNEFSSFSVPLVFEDRYFVLEPGDPPLLTVFIERNGEPVFEVLKNDPKQNDISEVTKSDAGIVTVSEKSSGRFLYKVRPGSETSIVFGRLNGEEISASITDRYIKVGDNTLENNKFVGNMAGVVVDSSGNTRIGAITIPEQVVKLLKGTS